MSMECFVFFGVLTFLMTTNRADALDCLLEESCILPCSFQPGAEVIVHWIQLADSPAHSYYHDQDQLGHQKPRFSGRTSLFKNQISRGNASLLLSGVKVDDEGRYKCYTSTVDHNKEIFIRLNVYAPVRKVELHQDGKNLTCSSEGIYPKPEISWSTEPPSNQNLWEKIKVQQIVHRQHGQNKMTATLFKQTSLSGSSTETTMPCTSSKSPPTGLIWRFNHNLTLKDLSTDHDGIYSCELRNAEGTYVTNTFLRIEHSQALSAGGIAGIVVAVLVVLAAVLLVLYVKLPKEPKVTLEVPYRFQQDASVHSFYRNQDHLEHQDPRFKGRMALFGDQIFRGNASLKLERVEIPDEGRYKCYTAIEGGSGHSASRKKTTCSSEGIYPEPQLTWSIHPPPNETLHNKTTVHQTEQKLYNISSSLNVTVTDVNYICTVSQGRNKMAATLFKLTSLSGSSTETTMPCTSSKILQQASSGGSTTVRSSCELRNAEGTHVTNTFLRIEQSQGNVSNLIYISLLIIPIAVAVGMLVYCKGKKGKITFCLQFCFVSF
ncbi:HERV-H LTR-associating protein 2 [Dissostichus eleginoides]|uniref:HERV-H LTR-associating protein 2 n=1 Tax=Dissostichus eleginoides TaxID=100907 RepID=A0AAD9BLI8_DISEL|nr:HERV-H LTR-associating protein 2 [Dissostichus eleginoides]